jgi:NADPH-dependent 2,4-dienoyl-CoA reductase/sulfur reductase-like enzyme
VETSTAFVIGGGMVGLESTDFLAAEGVKVTLVEMLDEVGGDGSFSEKGSHRTVEKTTCNNPH